MTEKFGNPETFCRPVNFFPDRNSQDRQEFPGPPQVLKFWRNLPKSSRTGIPGIARNSQEPPSLPVLAKVAKSCPGTGIPGIPGIPRNRGFGGSPRKPPPGPPQGVPGTPSRTPDLGGSWGPPGGVLGTPWGGPGTPQTPDSGGCPSYQRLIKVQTGSFSYRCGALLK